MIPEAISTRAKQTEIVKVHVREASVYMVQEEQERMIELEGKGTFRIVKCEPTVTVTKLGTQTR